MPSHSERVRRNYDPETFCPSLQGGQLTYLASIGRGIIIGWRQGKPLQVSRGYLLSQGHSGFVPPFLQSLVVE